MSRVICTYVNSTEILCAGPNEIVRVSLHFCAGLSGYLLVIYVIINLKADSNFLLIKSYSNSTSIYRNTTEP